MKIIFCKARFGRKGLRFQRSAILIMAGAILAGCPANNQAPPPPAPSATGKVVIRGSNTVGEELAPHLIAEFKKDHPQVDFDLETKATGYGMAALRAGQCDIAAASRTATKEEAAEAERMGVQLNDYVIGSYSVAVIVNANSPVANLTKAQVRDIFTGAVKNWKDVGGPDAEIHLYVRDPISGTYLGFKELAMDNKDYVEGCKFATNYADVAKQVGQDATGIGYSCFELPKDAGAKTVTIDGIAPTAENVNGGKYPYMRTLHFYMNKAREGGSAKDFVDFVQSAKGQGVLMASGFTARP
jgi:phosphate transport system substrate-binding protein